MAQLKLEYLTGIPRQIFRSVRLTGSWNGWQPTPMDEFSDDDGCIGFRRQVAVDDSFIGKSLRWGVVGLIATGEEMWLIPTEVKHPESRERQRELTLHGPEQREVYRLNLSRYLGANKFVVGGEERIRFSVWAPHAEKVEVVFGSIWDRDGDRLTPYDLALPGNPIPVERIAGGYISDDGIGIHPARPVLAMDRDEFGVWHSRPSDPELPLKLYDHRLYMYRVTRNDGSVRYRTDIYSRCQVGNGSYRPDGETYAGLTRDLDGTISCSVIVDPDKVTEFFQEPVWPEENFVSAHEFWRNEFTDGNRIPNRVEDLVIYEMHIGALGFGHDGPGTLQEAIAFLDHLQDLGINAVELLPLAEFGGSGENWGYATSHYFAIEYGGGGRDKYKFFIRECHRRGIAVIMDVVFNHYIHDAVRSQWQYDSTSHSENFYYWYEGTPEQYGSFDANVTEGRRGTGGYLDNESTGWAPRYHEELIRQMFISSMVALVEEFHVDGFRVDQTTSIHSYNRLHATGDSVSSANAFGAKMLREMTRTLKMIKPDVMLMAEDHSSDLTHVVRSPDEGGLGFDAAWYSNFYHSLIGDTNQGDKARLLAEAANGDDRPLSIDAFAEILASSGHGRVVYNESHDEAGNGHGTARTIRVAVNNAFLDGETRSYAEARVRWAAALTLLSAGTPMFLFGEEVGAEKDFLYGAVLTNREDLVGLRRGSGGNLFRFYADLVRLRLQRRGLKSRNLQIIYTHNENRILAFRRWCDGEQYLVVANLNNRPFNQPDYFMRTPSIPTGQWREIFNSDSGQYGGGNTGNGGVALTARRDGMHCLLPANGVLVFQKV